MSRAAFIAGDWGTSRLRLYLCDEDGHVLARAEGEGASAPDCAGRFAAAVKPWDKAHGQLPALLSGMVGSTIGWREVPYLKCPAKPAAIAAAALRFEVAGRAIAILPGLSCTATTGAPDVMRGEETQLLGALGLDAAGEALVCMPGTHSKWVRVKDGTVAHFSTFMTGELFSVVSRETILSLAVAGAEDAEDVTSFQAAVKAAYEAPAFAANFLFGARSRQLLFGGTPAAARETLSGTLIGVELAAGLSGAIPKAGITLIASGRLAMLYRLAFDALSVTVNPVDADEAVRRGLSMAAAAIWMK